MKVKFIVPLPDTNYYLQQCLIQITNFMDYGYDVDTHYLIGVVYGDVNPHARILADSPDIKAHFHFYVDERLQEEKSYSASLKPHLMYRYFKQHPWEKDCAYVYLDPDVIFLEAFDFTPYLNDDINYGSDVGSYIDSNYIKQKGEGLFEDFCDHFGISPEVVMANDKNCIGAQSLVKNNVPEYWLNVYKKSSDCYNYLSSRQSHYFKPEMVYWLQIFTLEMWTSLWEYWKNGIQTKHANEWAFHWGNHMAKDRVHKIYHNAGVAEQDQTKTIHYAKRAYEHKTPFNNPLLDLVSKDSLSYEYVKVVRKAEQIFPDLIW